MKSLQLGAVELHVHNLERMKQYYAQVVGLHILEENTVIVSLGHGTKEIIRLVASPNLPLPLPNSAGLYHTAILYASREELARTIKHIFDTAFESFVGSADHLVSEAFYFTDPELNGLELYYDKDPSGWIWKDNRIQMASLFINPIEYIAKYATKPGEISKKTGHVHLKVGDIEKAREFYVNALGFTVTAELPQALFISVGGYHHHLGLNTWESAGAGKRSKSLGLKKYELIVPDSQTLEDLKKKLSDNRILFKEQNNSIHLQDPWENSISIRT